MVKNTFVAEITFKIRFNKKLMELSKTKKGFFPVTLKVKLSWEQQKRLFTSSSSWARYHPVIIRFCLSATAKSPSV